MESFSKAHRFSIKTIKHLCIFLIRRHESKNILRYKDTKLKVPIFVQMPHVF